MASGVTSLRAESLYAAGPLGPTLTMNWTTGSSITGGNEMAKRFAFLLIVAAMLSVAFGGPVAAKQPLRADVALEFVGPGPMPWEGTLTFGDGADAVEYGIRYFSVDTGKPWGDTAKPNHKPLFFGEEWEVWTLGTAGEFVDKVMWGTDRGVGSPNLKAVANGYVTDVNTSADYSAGVIDNSLVGRKIHWSGDVTVIFIPGVGPVPTNFDGPFRIN